MDLALKNTYPLEPQPPSPGGTRWWATLVPALAEASERLAAQEVELASCGPPSPRPRRSGREITGGAGYRLLARASDYLERHDRLRRTATGAARRLAPRR